MYLVTAHSRLSLRFCIKDDAIGALEGALAVVRRTGAELRNLRAGLGTHGLEVWMHLSAHDADVLALCRTRLENLIGVADVLELGETIEHHAAVASVSEVAALEA